MPRVKRGTVRRAKRKKLLARTKGFYATKSKLYRSAKESVDTSLNTVSFRRPDGLTRVLAIEDPKAQAFIRQLKRGDRVKVTYMEAVAVSVRPIDRSGA